MPTTCFPPPPPLPPPGLPLDDLLLADRVDLGHELAAGSFAGLALRVLLGLLLQPDLENTLTEWGGGQYGGGGCLACCCSQTWKTHLT